jgi:hypothetical protein
MFIVWYKKTLKKTGKPVVRKNMITGEITYHAELNFEGCDARMKFNNTIDEAKVCGATTVLEIWI